jgi:hypothetical protein
VLHSAHSILRCRDADQTVPMMPCPEATSSKPALQCASHTPMQAYELQMKSRLLNILLELLNLEGVLYIRSNIRKISQTQIFYLDF